MFGEIGYISGRILSIVVVILCFISNEIENNILFSNLDGTLFLSDKTISKQNLEAVEY